MSHLSYSPINCPLFMIMCLLCIAFMVDCSQTDTIYSKADMYILFYYWITKKVLFYRKINLLLKREKINSLKWGVGGIKLDLEINISAKSSRLEVPLFETLTKAKELWKIFTALWRRHVECISPWWGLKKDTPVNGGFRRFQRRFLKILH